MYIVRWLMGHPIIATWVLGFIAILLTMDAGNKVKHEGADKSVASAHVADSLARPINTDEHKVASNTSTSEKEIKQTTETNTKEAPVVLPKITTANTAATTTTIPVVPQKDIAVTQQANDVSHQEVSNEGADLAQMSSAEMLLMAREAYWNNGLDEAADLYRQLIALEPDVVEHKGELGNVYWTQGSLKEAAELYSEIALPMIEKGKVDKVANMVAYIGLYFPEKAAKIKQKITSLQNSK